MKYAFFRDRRRVWFRTEFIGPPDVKILGKLAPDPEVGSCRTMGVITAPQWLQHLLA
jgi:hypothetical protein